jgi:hypothetical protein
MEGVLAIVNSVEELMLAYTAVCTCLEKISDKRDKQGLWIRTKSVMMVSLTTRADIGTASMQD